MGGEQHFIHYKIYKFSTLYPLYTLYTRGKKESSPVHKGKFDSPLRESGKGRQPFLGWNSTRQPDRAYSRTNETKRFPPPKSPTPQNQSTHTRMFKKSITNCFKYSEIVHGSFVTHRRSVPLLPISNSTLKRTHLIRAFPTNINEFVYKAASKTFYLYRLLFE